MDLFYREHGNGQPLLILHGLFGSSDNWLTLGKVFSTRFHTFLIDQRNHGRSENTEEFSYQILADDLKNFILDHKLENPIIIGHSMGGKAAMLFALQNPTLLDKLIVVDIAPKEYPVHHDTILEGLKAIDLKTLESRSKADEILSAYIPEVDVRQFLLKNLFRNDEKEFEWRMNLQVLEREIVNIGGNIDGAPIDVPTLFIRGLKSKYISDEDYEAIRNLFPNVKIETIEKAGHWVQAERPKEFMDVVYRFLG